MEIRPYAEGDADAIGRVLAVAFGDYLWTRWTVDGEDHSARIEALQRLAITELALPYGEVWVATEADHVVSPPIGKNTSAVTSKPRPA